MADRSLYLPSRLTAPGFLISCFERHRKKYVLWYFCHYTLFVFALPQPFGLTVWPWLALTLHQSFCCGRHVCRHTVCIYFIIHLFSPSHCSLSLPFLFLCFCFNHLTSLLDTVRSLPLHKAIPKNTDVVLHTSNVRSLGIFSLALNPHCRLSNDLSHLWWHFLPLAQDLIQAHMLHLLLVNPLESFCIWGSPLSVFLSLSWC